MSVHDAALLTHFCVFQGGICPAVALRLWLPTDTQRFNFLTKVAIGLGEDHQRRWTWMLGCKLLSTLYKLAPLCQEVTSKITDQWNLNYPLHWKLFRKNATVWKLKRMYEKLGCRGETARCCLMSLRKYEDKSYPNVNYKWPRVVLIYFLLKTWSVSPLWPWLTFNIHLRSQNCQWIVCIIVLYK